MADKQQKSGVPDTGLGAKTEAGYHADGGGAFYIKPGVCYFT